MTSVLYITSVCLAVFSMLFGNSKYSTYLSTSSMLALILITLEKTSVLGSVVLLLTFIIFETVCFTQTAWSFHRFNPPRTSRHKIFWITLCMTIGVSAVWQTSINLKLFSLSKISFEADLVKVLVPIVFCIYGLLRNKKKSSV